MRHLLRLGIVLSLLCVVLDVGLAFDPNSMQCVPGTVPDGPAHICKQIKSPVPEKRELNKDSHSVQRRSFQEVVSTNQCLNVLWNVKTSINQKLEAENLPTLSYKCVNKGQEIEVSANSVIFGEVNVSRVDQVGYLSLVTNQILKNVRGIFSGLSDDGEVTGTRHVSDNAFVDSDSISALTLKVRFNVGAVVDGQDPNKLVVARINGPLNYGQASETTFYAVTTLSGWETFVDPEYRRDGYLMAIWRSNFTLRKAIRYSVESTKANRMLARKYPDRYNVTAADNWHRDVVNYTGGSFAPLLYRDGLIFTGDNSADYELWNPEYYAGIPNPRDPEIKGFPQANGGPVMKEGWSVTNNIRHYQRATLMVFDAETLELKEVDCFADSGRGNRSDARGPRDKSDQGFYNPWQGMRMPQGFSYQGKDYLYVPGTMLDNLGSEDWLGTSYSETHVDVSLLNGNIERHHARNMLFEVIRNGTNVELKEVWTRHGHPRYLFAGDVNPFNANETFANDTRANEYSYQLDGCWSQGIVVDKERGILIYACANGKKRPAEEIIAAWNVPESDDPITGAHAYPQRTYEEWYRLFRTATTVTKRNKIHKDFVYTRKVQQAAIDAISPRAQEFAANSVVFVDILTGELVCVHHHTPFDMWQSYNFQPFYLPEDKIPLINRINMVAEGQDNDYPFGCIKSLKRDKLICVAKDSVVEEIDLDTCELKNSLRVGLPTSAGTANYGGLLIKDDLFISINNNDAVGYNFGNLAFKVSLDANNYPVIEYPDPVDMAELSKTPYATEKCLDDDKPKKVLLDARSLLLARVNTMKFEVTGVRTLNTPEEADLSSYVPFPTNIHGVNDVVLVGGGSSSKLRGFDAKSMKTLWQFDALADLKATTPAAANRTVLIANSAPLCLADEVYWPVSEVGFQGASAGRFIYKFKITS